MKKLLSLLLAVAMILTMSVMLFACDTTSTDADTGASTADTEAATEGETAAAHTCEFDTEAWAKNETAHWHACKTQNCPAKQDEAEHAFTSPVIEQTDSKITKTYTCEVCAYEKVDETTINSIVNNEATWDQAFENLSLINYSITITLKSPEGTHINHVEVGDTAAHYEIDGFVEYYTAKGEDGAFTTYVNYQGYGTAHQGFVKLTDNTTDEYYTSAATEALLQISFAENFKKFTYDAEKGAYVCADEIGATMFYPDGTPMEETMTCFNCVVKVADGKITYIEADYILSSEMEEDYDYSFCYYNIGMTEVIVPQSVIDSAVEKTEAEMGFGESEGPEDEEMNNVPVQPEQDQSSIPEKGEDGMDATTPEEGVTSAVGGMVSGVVNPDGSVSVGGGVVNPDGVVSGGLTGNVGIEESETAYAEAVKDKAAA